MKVVWIIGEPGVGKTTVVRELLGPTPSRNMKPKWSLVHRGIGIVAAGHYKGEAFDGADTVPYNGVADALDFWLDNYSGSELTIFDGDRFSHQKVVDFFKLRVPEHKLVCVQVLSARVELQRQARFAVTGKNQNATWLKGRATKVKNFFTAFPGERYELENVGSPAEVAKRLLTVLEAP